MPSKKAQSTNSMLVKRALRELIRSLHLRNEWIAVRQLLEAEGNSYYKARDLAYIQIKNKYTAEYKEIYNRLKEEHNKQKNALTNEQH